MSNPPPLLSPLRYPGSKRRLAIYVKQAIAKNCLKPSLYIEPFVGGGSVALQLLQEGLVDKAILIDVDPWIASFWKTVFFDSEWLIRRIKSADVSLDSWNRIKQSHPRTIREQAWACFFLNRTSFSGILEEKAGPLGGKFQTSEYRIDCRFPRATLIDRVQNISALRERISFVWCASWEKGIARVRAEQKKGTLPRDNLFFYFDPPFFTKAQDLYRYYFEPEDHIRLRDFLLGLRNKWILSYDSADEVFALYGKAIKNGTNGTRRKHIELLYSLSKLPTRLTTKEVLLTNLARLPHQIIRR